MPPQGTLAWFESEVKLWLPELRNAPELMIKIAENALRLRHGRYSYIISVSAGK